MLGSNYISYIPNLKGNTSNLFNQTLFENSQNQFMNYQQSLSNKDQYSLMAFSGNINISNNQYKSNTINNHKQGAQQLLLIDKILDHERRIKSQIKQNDLIEHIQKTSLKGNNQKQLYHDQQSDYDQNEYYNEIYQQSDYDDNNDYNNKQKHQKEKKCKHTNKQQQLHHQVCVDCGFVIETQHYQSSDCNFGKRLFTPIYNSEVRELMKENNFEESCKSRINQQFEIFENQEKQMQQQISFLNTQNIKQNKKQIKSLIKQQQQNQYLLQCIKSINNIVIQDAINISIMIFKYIKISGNNHYKIFLFITKYMCEIECIILTFKQLCNLLGFKIDDYSSWLRVGQKMFQEFKFIRQLNLKDDKQVVILLRKQSIEITNQIVNQNADIAIETSNNKQIIDPLSQLIQQANQVLKNYQFEESFNICLFILFKNHINKYNLLFKQIEQTKHRFIYMLLKYLDVIYSYQIQQNLSDEQVIHILNMKLTVKSPIWSNFIHSINKNINMLFITKFKQSMKELASNTSFQQDILEQFNTFNIKSNNSVKNIINDILILQHQVKSQINPELGLHIDLNQSQQSSNVQINDEFQIKINNYSIYLNALFIRFN